MRKESTSFCCKYCNPHTHYPTIIHIRNTSSITVAPTPEFKDPFQLPLSHLHHFTTAKWQWAGAPQMPSATTNCLPWCRLRPGMARMERFLVLLSCSTRCPHAYVHARMVTYVRTCLYTHMHIYTHTQLPVEDDIDLSDVDLDELPSGKQEL